MGVWHHPTNAPSRQDPSLDTWPRGELETVRFHPYSVHLGAALAGDASPGDRAAGYAGALRHAVAHAYSGWKAEELRAPLSAALARGPWRACVVQAGVNDVVGGAAAERTLPHVLALYEACDRAGVPVVVVPNTDADLVHHGMCADGVSARRELGELARLLSDAAGEKGRAVARAREEMPMEQSHSYLWDDCVHYSAAGAAVMAEVVYRTMCDHDL